LQVSRWLGGPRDVDVPVRRKLFFETSSNPRCACAQCAPRQGETPKRGAVEAAVFEGRLTNFEGAVRCAARSPGVVRKDELNGGGDGEKDDDTVLTESKFAV